MVKNIARASAKTALSAFLFILVLGFVPRTSDQAIQSIAPERAEAKTIKIADPAKLIIPKISVNSNIIGMGLTEEGKMAVPNNFTQIGWYSLGTKPGELGSAVMGAHVDNGGKIPGVFKNLKKLQVGDSITVLDKSGNRLQFKVTNRRVYSSNEKETAEVFLAASSARLNLITCYGTWLPKQNTYDKRLVVTAELQNIIPS